MHALITSSLQQWPYESLMELRVPLQRVCGRTSVSRHALRDLLHISRDTLLAVLRTMCVRHVNLSSD